MTRRAILALLILSLAALACSVQPDTAGVITVYNVHGIARPTVTADVNVADRINISGGKVTPVVIGTED